MSELVIVFTNEKGGVSICFPSGDLPIEEVKKKDVPPNVLSFVVEKSSLPHEDNDFFDAWEQSNGVVNINMEKAKEITKNRLRIERTPLLAAQDIEFQKALETGADVSEIISEKQRLRNITNLADSANSLDELRSISVKK